MDGVTGQEQRTEVPPCKFENETNTISECQVYSDNILPPLGFESQQTSSIKIEPETGTDIPNSTLHDYPLIKEEPITDSDVLTPNSIQRGVIMEIKAVSYFENSDSDADNVDVNENGGHEEERVNVGDTSSGATIPKKHSIGKQYPHPTCTICNKTFTRQEIYDKHMNAIHEKKLEFKCQKCGHSSLYKHCLYRHLRQQHGISGREFMDVYSDNVLIPRKTPQDDRQCKICQKTFAKPSRLKLHMNAKHIRTEEHMCRLCGKGYLSKNSLTQHLRVHHGLTEADDLLVNSEVLKSKPDENSKDEAD